MGKRFQAEEAANAKAWSNHPGVGNRVNVREKGEVRGIVEAAPREPWGP